MKKLKLSTGRIINAELSYIPCLDGGIVAIEGYDYMVRDINDEVAFVEAHEYMGGDAPIPITHAERIEIAQWQLGLWQEYIERLILKGEV